MKHAALVALALLLATRPARAELFGEAEEVARDVAENTVDSVRRSIAFGPSVGYVAGATTDGQLQAGLTFGLSLYTFHRPSMKERIVRAARERVTSRLTELVRSGHVSDLRNIPDELMADVKREAANQVQPRTFEKPQLKIGLEGTLFQEPGGFQARAMFAYGIGYASLGLNAGVQHANDLTMLVGGPELSVHLTPIGKARTPVVDIYARTDFGVGEGERSVAFLGGARVALDVL